MSRSYNLKNSPINKGTAAKPSPMKEPITAAIIGSLVAGGIGAISSSVGGKKQRKANLKAEGKALQQDATAQFASKKVGGGTGTRLA